ncbi:MAG TPA: sigma-70 family RNA polymerase sigma factor [Gemmataceae bacterium]|jgi:RNA polymerase sigma factor (sigma-70 family)
MANPVHTALLYHFCRLRLPAIALPLPMFESHLQRAFELSRAKHINKGETTSWESFLENLHAVDWFLACACLEGRPSAWEVLFAARANRTDSLLVDALRLRAVRLFPRDQERQDESVAEFWGYLLAGERDGSLPILARYDGQRPLVPWLIRVFQNKHLSDLRHRNGLQPLPEDDLGERDLPFSDHGHERWYDEFHLAAREWLDALTDQEVLILGLRLRYRLSQREVAAQLGIHEGNVSRQTTRLRDHCLEQIGEHLRTLGWTGDDLSGFIFKEMDSLLLDEPRLSADRLAALLAARGKCLPDAPPSLEKSTGERGA